MKFQDRFDRQAAEELVRGDYDVALWERVVRETVEDKLEYDGYIEARGAELRAAQPAVTGGFWARLRAIGDNADPGPHPSDLRKQMADDPEPKDSRMAPFVEWNGKWTDFYWELLDWDLERCGGCGRWVRQPHFRYPVNALCPWCGHRHTLLPRMS